jgi:hypothetical protein
MGVWCQHRDDFHVVGLEIDHTASSVIAIEENVHMGRMA